MTMKIPAGATCCKPVRGSTFRFHPCGKAAKVRADDGKLYCGIHDPGRRAARLAATEARWDAKAEAQQAARAVAAARDRIVQAAKDAARQAGSWDAVAAAVEALEPAEKAAEEARRKAQELDPKLKGRVRT